MRPIIGVKDYFEKVLNSSLAFSVAGITVPVGLLICFGLLCGLVHLFVRTKTGRAILAVGENETFARLAGIDVRKMRTTAVVLSNLIGSWGIVVCFCRRGPVGRRGYHSRGPGVARIHGGIALPCSLHRSTMR